MKLNDSVVVLGADNSLSVSLNLQLRISGHNKVDNFLYSIDAIDEKKIIDFISVKNPKYVFVIPEMDNITLNEFDSIKATYITSLIMKVCVEQKVPNLLIFFKMETNSLNETNPSEADYNWKISITKNLLLTNIYFKLSLISESNNLNHKLLLYSNIFGNTYSFSNKKCATSTIINQLVIAKQNLEPSVKINISEGTIFNHIYVEDLSKAGLELIKAKKSKSFVFNIQYYPRPIFEEFVSSIKKVLDYNGNILYKKKYVLKDFKQLNEEIASLTLTIRKRKPDLIDIARKIIDNPLNLF